MNGERESASCLIVGAGVAGLSAAYELARLQPGMKITVLEKDAHVGGMARTLEWEGCRLDLGPHRFYTELPEVDELVHRCAAQQMLRVERRSRMWLRERWLAYPVRPLEVSTALGWKQAFRVGMSAVKAGLLRPQEPMETYAEYVRAYYGQALAEMLFEPYAEKVWGVSPQTLAAETAVVRLRGDNIWHAFWDSFRGKGETYVKEFGYPYGGIGAIADGLREKAQQAGVEILCGAEVESLEVDEETGNVTSLRYRCDGSHREVEADSVISTLPLPSLCQRMGTKIEREALRRSEGLRFRSLVLLFLRFARDLQVQDTWLYFPEAEVPFSRVSLPHNFEPSCVPEGETVLLVELPCDFNDERWGATDRQLVESISPHLEETQLARGEMDAFLTARLRWGYPIYALDTQKILREVYSGLSAFPNLISTGRQGLFRHNNLDQSIQMGLLAARCLDRFAGDPNGNPAERWYSEVSQFDSYRIVD